MARVSSVRELSDRLVRAIRETGVLVVSRDLVDVNALARIVSIAGVDALLGRHAEGDLVIYYVRDSIAESRCRQTACRNLPPERFRACMAECFYRELANVVDTLESNIREAASSIAEDEV